jgi:chromate reductase
VRILVIIGGISKNSINKKLFELIKPLAPKDFEFDSYDISLLPFYSQDIEANLPDIVIEFKKKFHLLTELFLSLLSIIV